MELVTDKLVTMLNNAVNEREIMKHLKSNPLLVRNAFNVWSWNFAEAIPEFSLGGDYKVDFLVLSADSSHWNVIFVEFKSHRAKLFTKSGLPTKELNLALAQLRKRAIWVDRNEVLLREHLSRYLSEQNIPAFCSNAAEHFQGSTEIRDPRTWIDYRYVAVIGRRDSLNSEDRDLRNSLRKPNCEIATYDRLVDVAIRLDKATYERQKKSG